MFARVQLRNPYQDTLPTQQHLLDDASHIQLTIAPRGYDGAKVTLKVIHDKSAREDTRERILVYNTYNTSSPRCLPTCAQWAPRNARIGSARKDCTAFGGPADTDKTHGNNLD